MTVGKLKEILEGLDDDMLVVAHGSDHSYIKIDYCGEVSAECSRGDYYEFYNKQNMREGGEEVKVFLTSDM